MNDSTSIVAERSRQCVEHGDAVLEERVVVGVLATQAFNEVADRGGFGQLVPGLLHVEVVDDLAYAAHGGGVYFESLGQDFEGARGALVAKLPFVPRPRFPVETRTQRSRVDR